MQQEIIVCMYLSTYVYHISTYVCRLYVKPKNMCRFSAPSIFCSYIQPPPKMSHECE